MAFTDIIKKVKKTSSVEETKNYESASIEQKLDVIGKNTMVLPMMHRDLNVIRQSIIKLVRLQGGTQRDKADRFFLRASTREEAYEAQFKKKEEEKSSATKVSREKGSGSGILQGLMSGIMNTVLGGLGSLIMKGVGIAVFGKFIKDFIQDEEFRNTVLTGIVNIFKGIGKFLLENEAGKSLLIGISTLAGLVLTWKAAVSLITTGLASLGTRLAGMAVGEAVGGAAAGAVGGAGLAATVASLITAGVVVAAIAAVVAMVLNSRSNAKKLNELEFKKGKTDAETFNNVKQSALDKGYSEDTAHAMAVREWTYGQDTPENRPTGKDFWLGKGDLRSWWDKTFEERNDEDSGLFRWGRKKRDGMAKGGTLVAKSPISIGNQIVAGESGPERITVSPIDKPLGVIIKEDDSELGKKQLKAIQQAQASSAVTGVTGVTGTPFFSNTPTFGYVSLNPNVGNTTPTPTPSETPTTTPKTNPSSVSNEVRMPMPSDNFNGRPNAKRAYEFLIKNGKLSPNAAAGIVGNLLVESGNSAGSDINPNAKGDVDKKTGIPTSFGIAQWHNDKPDKGRWKNLEDFAKKRDKSPSDLDTQLEFLLHELNTGYKDTYKKLKKEDVSVESASDAFMVGFERPKDQSKNAKGIRSTIAQHVREGKFNFKAMPASQLTPKEDNGPMFSSDAINKMTEDWKKQKKEHDANIDLLRKTYSEKVAQPGTPLKQSSNTPQASQTLASANVIDTTYVEMLTGGLWQRNFGTYNA